MDRSSKILLAAILFGFAFMAFLNTMLLNNVALFQKQLVIRETVKPVSSPTPLVGIISEEASVSASPVIRRRPSPTPEVAEPSPFIVE